MPAHFAKTSALEFEVVIGSYRIRASAGASRPWLVGLVTTCRNIRCGLVDLSKSEGKEECPD